MISLCPKCHAKVERTQIVLVEMAPLLLELWREQHPEGIEQLGFNFTARQSLHPLRRLFDLDNVPGSQGTNEPGVGDREVREDGP